MRTGFNTTGWYETLEPRVEFRDASTVSAFIVPLQRFLNHNGTIAGPILIAIGEVAAGALLVNSGAFHSERVFFAVDRLGASLTYPARTEVRADASMDAEVIEQAVTDAVSGETVRLGVNVVLSTDRVIGYVEVEFVIRLRR